MASIALLGFLHLRNVREIGASRRHWSCREGAHLVPSRPGTLWRAAYIGFGGDRIRVRRWALVVVEAIGGACKQADPHIVLRHNDGAVTMERGIAAGLLAMEVGVDEILYGRSPRQSAYMSANAA
jgi:hypothetical protein